MRGRKNGDAGRQGQREVLAANLLLYLPNFFCPAWRVVAVEESVMIKKKKKKKAAYGL